jgi:hypothetical protein
MNYKDIHDRIIEKAKKENRSKGDGNYYEAHHIVPRCMVGEGSVKQWRTHPNIVLLTAKEHFVIHKLLCEIYPDNHKLLHAYWRFVNGNQSRNHNGNKYYNVGSREYERIKTNCAVIQSETFSKEGNPMFEKSHSEETKQKIGEKNRKNSIGRVVSEQTKQKQRESSTGKTHNEETKQKQREKKIGKYDGENNPKAKKVICNITGKIYGCVKDASEDLGIKYSTLYAWLNGKYTNKTTLQLLID